jgi:hypothetical protein
MLFRILLIAHLMVAGGLPVAGASDAAGAPRPLFKEFMGLNGHTVQFRPGLYRPVAGLARDYHPAEWDLGKTTEVAAPLPFARNGVDWSKVYGAWRSEGWRIDGCLMFETVPRGNWKDLPADARAYAERLARAFGPSGSNPLLESVEIGNEPGSYSDADYRAVFESMAQGFRTGDARLRVATCALTTGKSHAYAKSVECLGGLTGLYDVLTLHTYAQLEGWPTWRRSFPEDPKLKDYLPDVRRLCAWRDEQAPGKEVWITEFGYDATTRAPDPKSEFKQWVGVSEEQQAQWIVRSWLVFASLPVQRAYLYFFNDDDAPQMHGSSGLTRRFEPKPAFHAAAHLQRTLGAFRFSRIVVDRPGDALVYEFVSGKDPGRRIWVVWSPTGSNRTGSLALPAFDGVIERAEKMPLSAGEDPQVRVSPGAREVGLSEAPLYLFLSR